MNYLHLAQLANQVSQFPSSVAGELPKLHEDTHQNCGWKVAGVRHQRLQASLQILQHREWKLHHGGREVRAGGLSLRPSA